MGTVRDRAPRRSAGRVMGGGGDGLVALAARSAGASRHAVAADRDPLDRRRPGRRGAAGAEPRGSPDRRWPPRFRSTSDRRTGHQPDDPVVRPRRRVVDRHAESRRVAPVAARRRAVHTQRGAVGRLRRRSVRGQGRERVGRHAGWPRPLPRVRDSDTLREAWVVVVERHVGDRGRGQQRLDRHAQRSRSMEGRPDRAGRLGAGWCQAGHRLADARSPGAHLGGDVSGRHVSAGRPFRQGPERAGRLRARDDRGPREDGVGERSAAGNVPAARRTHRRAPALDAIRRRDRADDGAGSRAKRRVAGFLRRGRRVFRAWPRAGTLRRRAGRGVGRGHQSVFRSARRAVDRDAEWIEPAARRPSGHAHRGAGAALCAGARPRRRR